MIEFGWKVIEDLGKIYLKPTHKRKSRAKIYECPMCGDHNTMIYLKYYKNKPKGCHACVNKLRRVKDKRNDRRAYQLWCNIKQRCYNKKHPNFIDYGGRGIVMCEEWKNDYKVFEKWVLSSNFKQGLSIERKNNDDIYSPDNCTFANQFVQTVNTRIRKDNTSGIKGLSYCNTYKVWNYEIQRNNIRSREKFKTLDLFFEAYPQFE